MSKSEISSKKSIAIIFATIVSISICVIKGFSLFYGFVGAIIFASFILIGEGFGKDKILKSLFKGIWDCKSVYFVILLMGSTISIWMASGVVPMLMYHGFFYIGNMNFLFACFIATSVLSYVMGTAVGTISTIGMALFGVGMGFGIPKEILIGTLVSGSYIADKMSPVSGLLNLTIDNLDVNYKEFMKEQMKTFTISFLIAAIFYYILGLNFPSHAIAEDIDLIRTGIEANFNISIWLMLFPLGVIFLAIRGVKTVYTMSSCVVVGAIVAYFYQGNSIVNILNWIWDGFVTNSGIEKVDTIIKGGGISPMIEVVLIVMGAVALSSLFEIGGVFTSIINKFIKNSKNNGMLIAKTSILSMLLTTLTCDQTVGILIPGKELRDEFDNRGIGRAKLASVIADSGVIIAPLEFWNVNAIILMALLNVSALKYGPYAFFCYISPVVLIIHGLIVKTGNEVEGEVEIEKL